MTGDGRVKCVKARMGSPSGGCGRRGFRACRMQKRTNKLHMLLLPPYRWLTSGIYY
jgi:hypothetical protein